MGARWNQLTRNKDILNSIASKIKMEKLETVIYK
jgi:hypothetical protein